MTGQAVNDKGFLAVAEGLASLRMLEKLILPGYYFHVTSISSKIYQLIAHLLSETRKRAVEEMKTVHWPLLKKIEWTPW
jgi:hypothetical protein